MDDEVKKFWSAFEKETGEKVEARSEGLWFRLPKNGRGHEGLLILTDKSFRFKYVPDTERTYMSSGVSPEHADQSEFTVARDDIISVRMPKRGFFSWFRRQASPRYALVARGEGGERTYVFSTDPSSDLIAALKRRWPDASDAGIQ